MYWWTQLALSCRMVEIRTMSASLREVGIVRSFWRTSSVVAVPWWLTVLMCLVFVSDGGKVRSEIFTASRCEVGLVWGLYSDVSVFAFKREYRILLRSVVLEMLRHVPEALSYREQPMTYRHHTSLLLCPRSYIYYVAPWVVVVTVRVLVPPMEGSR